MGQLVQHSSTRANTVFHVLAGDGTVLGSINCPRGEENNSLRHWRGAPAPGHARRDRRGSAMVFAHGDGFPFGMR
jgi:hypothetical protein